VSHVVRVARVDGFPGVAGRIRCRNIKHRDEPVLPVRPVVGQLGLGDDPNNGRGGRGGNAHAIGGRSTAIGGYGGRGGVGPGGDGGHGRATGHGSVSIGGDGAHPAGWEAAASEDQPKDLAFLPICGGPGRGGRGSCTPESIRLREVLSDICKEYLERFPEDVPSISAGLEQAPTDWLNRRLVELGERWQVDGDDAFRTPLSLDQ
jgi:hypothetical protein